MLPLIFHIVREKLICETTTHAASCVARLCLSLRVKVRFDYIWHPVKIAGIQSNQYRIVAGRDRRDTELFLDVPQRKHDLVN